MHTNILAVLYFISGYTAAFFMVVATEYHVKAFGVFLLIYITYILVQQLEE
jgi:hypothetical protein